MKQAFLFFFFIAVIVNGQAKEEKYVTCSLIKKDPDKKTELESLYKGKVVYQAEINSGGLFKNVFIFTRDSAVNIGEYCIYYVNKLMKLCSIDFKSIGNNLYRAEENLITADEDKICPLIILLDTGKKEIKYRWNNSEDYRVPKIIQEYPLKPGMKFPPVTVETDNGEWHSDKKDKLIVINWWSTGCMPCRMEMPGLNKLVEKYKGKNVEFLSILSDKKNSAEFFKERKFDYIHGYGNEEIEKLLGGTFPRNIILSKDGIILHNMTGGSETVWQELDKIIEANL